MGELYIATYTHTFCGGYLWCWCHFGKCILPVFRIFHLFLVWVRIVQKQIASGCEIPYEILHENRILHFIKKKKVKNYTTNKTVWSSTNTSLPDSICTLDQIVLNFTMAVLSQSFPPSIKQRKTAHEMWNFYLNHSFIYFFFFFL